MQFAVFADDASSVRRRKIRRLDGASADVVRAHTDLTSEYSAAVASRDEEAFRRILRHPSLTAAIRPDTSPRTHNRDQLRRIAALSYYNIGVLYSARNLLLPSAECFIRTVSLCADTDTPATTAAPASALLADTSYRLAHAAGGIGRLLLSRWAAERALAISPTNADYLRAVRDAATALDDTTNANAAQHVADAYFITLPPRPLPSPLPSPPVSDAAPLSRRLTLTTEAPLRSLIQQLNAAAIIQDDDDAATRKRSRAHRSGTATIHFVTDIAGPQPPTPTPLPMPLPLLIPPREHTSDPSFRAALVDFLQSIGANTHPPTSEAVAAEVTADENDAATIADVMHFIAVNASSSSPHANCGIVDVLQRALTFVRRRMFGVRDGADSARLAPMIAAIYDRHNASLYAAENVDDVEEAIFFTECVLDHYSDVKSAKWKEIAVFYHRHVATAECQSISPAMRTRLHYVEAEYYEQLDLTIDDAIASIQSLQTAMTEQQCRRPHCRSHPHITRETVAALISQLCLRRVIQRVERADDGDDDVLRLVMSAIAASDRGHFLFQDLTRLFTLVCSKVSVQTRCEFVSALFGRLLKAALSERTFGQPHVDALQAIVDIITPLKPAHVVTISDYETVINELAQVLLRIVTADATCSAISNAVTSIVLLIYSLHQWRYLTSSTTDAVFALRRCTHSILAAVQTCSSAAAQLFYRESIRLLTAATSTSSWMSVVIKVIPSLSPLATYYNTDTVVIPAEAELRVAVTEALQSVHCLFRLCQETSTHSPNDVGVDCDIGFGTAITVVAVALDDYYTRHHHMIMPAPLFDSLLSLINYAANTILPPQVAADRYCIVPQPPLAEINFIVDMMTASINGVRDVSAIVDLLPAPSTTDTAMRMPHLFYYFYCVYSLPLDMTRLIHGDDYYAGSGRRKEAEEEETVTIRSLYWSLVLRPRDAVLWFAYGLTQFARTNELMFNQFTTLKTERTVANDAQTGTNSEALSAEHGPASLVWLSSLNKCMRAWLIALHIAHSSGLLPDVNVFTVFDAETETTYDDTASTALLTACEHEPTRLVAVTMWMNIGFIGYRLHELAKSLPFISSASQSERRFIPFYLVNGGNNDAHAQVRIARRCFRIADCLAPSWLSKMMIAKCTINTEAAADFYADAAQRAMMQYNDRSRLRDVKLNVSPLVALHQLRLQATTKLLAAEELTPAAEAVLHCVERHTFSPAVSSVADLSFELRCASAVNDAIAALTFCIETQPKSVDALITLSEIVTDTTVSFAWPSSSSSAVSVPSESSRRALGVWLIDRLRPFAHFPRNKHFKFFARLGDGGSEDDEETSGDSAGESRVDGNDIDGAVVLYHVQWWQKAVGEDSECYFRSLNAFLTVAAALADWNAVVALVSVISPSTISNSPSDVRRLLLLANTMDAMLTRKVSVESSVLDAVCSKVCATAAALSELGRSDLRDALIVGAHAMHSRIDTTTPTSVRSWLTNQRWARRLNIDQLAPNYQTHDVVVSDAVAATTAAAMADTM